MAYNTSKQALDNDAEIMVPLSYRWLFMNKKRYYT